MMLFGGDAVVQIAKKKKAGLLRPFFMMLMRD